MPNQALQVFSISTTLLASGGIATFSAFDIPVLISQPASRSLPSTRWLFSRGSHIFPFAAILSSASFTYLSYSAIPSASNSRLLTHLTLGTPGLYAIAAALSLSIAPWTRLVMVPTNFELIRLNEEMGGARSEKAKEVRRERGKDQRGRTAQESVNGEGDVSQVTDLSGPQEKTERESSEARDREVQRLLRKFALLNWVRAVLIGGGGIVGLIAALG